jgi:hypothetical protein
MTQLSKYKNFKSLIVVLIVFVAQNATGQNAPCLSVAPLVCGVNSNYTLVGSGVWSPPTGPWGTPGNEQVFSYTAPVSASYDVQVTNNNYYVDLFYSTSCGPGGWTYVNDVLTNEVSSINLTAGVTYYFLLDDENTAPSSGFISISCPCIPPAGGIDQTLQVSSQTTSYASSTIDACNDCSLRTSSDRVLEVEVICAGDYTFSFCNQATWDTYLYLTDQPCGGTTIAFNDDNCGLQSTISANLSVGTYYLAIEGYSATSAGDFILSITTTCDFTPLPVELLFFMGEYQDRKNYLNWRTVSEIENDYFILERSQDGVDFTEIATVEGNGTTSLPMDYLYVDETFSGGLNYYRLKQVDFNGYNETFKTIALSSDYEEDLTLFPNPTKNIIRVSSKDQLIDPILTVQNAMVQTVLIENFNSGNELVLEINEKPGAYLVTIVSGNQVITRKLIVQ